MTTWWRVGWSVQHRHARPRQCARVVLIVGAALIGWVDAEG